jgi:uncharacterized protein (TIGR03435 family)
VVLATSLVLGQADATSFDVAAIRRHLGEVSVSMDPTVRGTRVTATASTVVDMITVAYDLTGDRVIGGPAWIRNEHFDLEARTPGDAPPTTAQFRGMMRTLLAERFKLTVHWETKPTPIYLLVVGKDGPKLKPGRPDTTGSSVRGSESGLRMVTTNGSLESLARQLSVTAGRPVVDKTGLAGTYAYTLEWFPANRIPPSDSVFPSMFTALDEQLGLRLDPAAGSLEVLFVEGVEMPTEN